MTEPLLEKAALVTGASRGIGQAIAIKLAELGANVGLVQRGSGAETTSAIEATAGSVGLVYSYCYLDPGTGRNCFGYQAVVGLSQIKHFHVPGDGLDQPDCHKAPVLNGTRPRSNMDNCRRTFLYRGSHLLQGRKDSIPSSYLALIRYRRYHLPLFCGFVVFWKLRR